MIFHMAGQLKEEIIETGKKLVDLGLVVATWGNISCRVPRTSYFYVTSSGMPYHGLQPSDLVVMNLAGEIVEGVRKPSTEVRMHQEIYCKRSDVHAIVHTHSHYACSFAVAGKAIPPILEEMAQLIGGPVQVARYALPGTEALAENAVDALGNRNAALLSNHGVVAVGPSLQQALIVAQVVEKSARVFLGAAILGTPQVLSPEEITVLREQFLHHYGQKPTGDSGDVDGKNGGERL